MIISLVFVPAEYEGMSSDIKALYIGSSKKHTCINQGEPNSKAESCDIQCLFCSSPYVTTLGVSLDMKGGHDLSILQFKLLIDRMSSIFCEFAW
jgi:hypothetical protein